MRTVIVRVSSLILRRCTASSAARIRSRSPARAARCATSSATPSPVAAARVTVRTNSCNVVRSCTAPARPPSPARWRRRRRRPGRPSRRTGAVSVPRSPWTPRPLSSGRRAGVCGVESAPPNRRRDSCGARYAMISVPGMNSWVRPVNAWVRITESMTLRSTVSGTYILVPFTTAGQCWLPIAWPSSTAERITMSRDSPCSVSRCTTITSPSAIRATTAVAVASSQASTSPSRSRTPRARDSASSVPRLVVRRSRLFWASHWSRTRSSTLASRSRSVQAGSFTLPSTVSTSMCSPFTRPRHRPGRGGHRAGSAEEVELAEGRFLAAGTVACTPSIFTAKVSGSTSSFGVRSLRTMSRLVRLRQP